MQSGEIIAQKDAIIARQEAELEQLREELAWIKGQLFGQKRERFEGGHPEQLQLDLGREAESVAPPAEEAEEEQISYRRKKKKHPGRHPLPPHLERVEMVIEPEEDTTGLLCIGEEITEVLARIPGRNYVIRYLRKKYLKADGKAVLIGCLPSRAIEKGIAHESVLADMIVSKYVDHLPLYRQAQIWKRDGVVMALSTMSGWMDQSAQLLSLLYDALVREVTTEAEYLQADESPMQVLDKPKNKQKKKKKGPPGKSHRGYQWVYLDVDANLVLFDYQKGRGRDGPNKLLKNFKGYLQTDGYSVYEQYEDHPDITLLGCMAHARRHFVKAKSNDPKRANHFLTEVQKLYQIERDLKEEKAPAEQIRKVRQQKAVPILQQLAKWFIQEYPKVLPKSAIGKAIQYAHSRWEKISRYTSDGNFKIDNNLIENRIRPLALGRKNWLFAGSHHAAQNTAIFYSLLGSAILNGHDPYKYLFAVLTHLPDYPINKIQELLPHRLTFDPKEAEKA